MVRLTKSFLNWPDAISCWLNELTLNAKVVVPCRNSIFLSGSSPSPNVFTAKFRLSLSASPKPRSVWLMPQPCPKGRSKRSEKSADSLRNTLDSAMFQIITRSWVLLLLYYMVRIQTIMAPHRHLMPRMTVCSKITTLLYSTYFVLHG